MIDPATGAAGVTGCELITTLVRGGEIHPYSFVTVNEYVFGGSPPIVILVPVPVTTVPPGVRVSVQVPVEGRPLSEILPVATVHVGWMTDPCTGAPGMTGCGSILASAGTETHVLSIELLTLT